MSEKLVNVCDVKEHCRHLSDGNCIICGIDACSDHLKCKLYIRIGTTSPIASNDTTKFAVPVAAEEMERGVCEKCTAVTALTLYKATGNRGGREATIADVKMQVANMNPSQHKPSWPAVFKAMMEEMMKRTAEELRIADAQIRLGGAPGSDE